MEAKDPHSCLSLPRLINGYNVSHREVRLSLNEVTEGRGMQKVLQQGILNIFIKSTRTIGQSIKSWHVTSRI